MPDPGPLPRVFRLVPIEETALQDERPRGHARDGDGSLQNLAPVVIHRVAQGRAIHGIVGPEGREPLPRAE